MLCYIGLPIKKGTGSRLVLMCLLSVVSTFSSVAISQNDSRNSAEMLRDGTSAAIGLGFKPDSPNGRLVVSWAQQLFSDPLLAQVMSRIQSPHDIEPVIGSLIEEGAPLLSDEVLRRRMQLELRMLEKRRSSSECSRLAGHPRYKTSARMKTFLRALSQLGEADLRFFLGFSKEAIFARLRHPQFVPYEMTLLEHLNLWAEIGLRVPTDKSEQWVAMWLEPESLSDAAYCDAVRNQFRAVLKLSESYAKQGLRFQFAR
jgi:hypothetical protein